MKNLSVEFMFFWLLDFSWKPPHLWKRSNLAVRTRAANNNRRLLQHSAPMPAASETCYPLCLQTGSLLIHSPCQRRLSRRSCLHLNRDWDLNLFLSTPCPQLDTRTRQRNLSAWLPNLLSIQVISHPIWFFGVPDNIMSKLLPRWVYTCLYTYNGRKNPKQTSTVLFDKTWYIGQRNTIHGIRERLMENIFELGYKKSGAWNRVRDILLTYFGFQLSHPAINYFLSFFRGSLYSPASYSPLISACWISLCLQALALAWAILVWPQQSFVR